MSCKCFGPSLHILLGGSLRHGCAPTPADRPIDRRSHHPYEKNQRERQRREQHHDIEPDQQNECATEPRQEHAHRAAGAFGCRVRVAERKERKHAKNNCSYVAEPVVPKRQGDSQDPEGDARHRNEAISVERPDILGQQREKAVVPEDPAFRERPACQHDLTSRLRSGQRLAGRVTDFKSNGICEDDPIGADQHQRKGAIGTLNDTSRVLVWRMGVRGQT